jgi:hypothetical protein
MGMEAKKTLKGGFILFSYRTKTVTLACQIKNERTLNASRTKRRYLMDQPAGGLKNGIEGRELKATSLS